jgi:serine/threonine protein kinase
LNFLQLQIQRDVDFYDNIIRCCGVTKLESGIINYFNKYNILLISKFTEIHFNYYFFYSLDNHNNYVLVMEYADGGSLRDYLKENFNNLTWDDKYNMAYQLSDAVSCLHSEGIVHRDLVIHLFDYLFI